VVFNKQRSLFPLFFFVFGSSNLHLFLFSKISVNLLSYKIVIVAWQIHEK
jgi:hypothetical protein